MPLDIDTQTIKDGVSIYLGAGGGPGGSIIRLNASAGPSTQPRCRPAGTQMSGEHHDQSP